jgi:hypothetical protein
MGAKRKKIHCFPGRNNGNNEKQYIVSLRSKTLYDPGLNGNNGNNKREKLSE